MIIQPSAGTGVNPMYPAGAQCAHCGSPASRSPAGIEWHLVRWAGPGDDTSTTLFFHPACAIEFALRLLRDVHEIECRHRLGVVLTTDTPQR